MNLKELPSNYKDWLTSRELHMQHDLAKNNFTTDLYKQYKLHLGLFRYKLLLEGQKLVVPDTVYKLLKFKQIKLLKPVLALFKLTRKLRLDGFFKSAILPKEYKAEIKELDVV